MKYLKLLLIVAVMVVCGCTSEYAEIQTEVSQYGNKLVLETKIKNTSPFDLFMPAKHEASKYTIPMWYIKDKGCLQVNYEWIAPRYVIIEDADEVRIIKVPKGSTITRTLVIPVPVIENGTYIKPYFFMTKLIRKQRMYYDSYQTLKTAKRMCPKKVKSVEVVVRLYKGEMPYAEAERPFTTIQKHMGVDRKSAVLHWFPQTWDKWPVIRVRAKAKLKTPVEYRLPKSYEEK